MRMNYRKVELSDYQEISKKKTIINCEEMQYFQEDEEQLSDAEDEEDEEDGDEERKVGSASTGGGGKLMGLKPSKNPNSATSTQLQTVKTNKEGGGTDSFGEESKGGEPVVAAEQ